MAMAKKKATRRPAKRGAGKAVAKSARRAKKARRGAASRKPSRAAKKASRKGARRGSGRAAAKKATPKRSTARKAAGRKRATVPRRAPTLDRARRTVAETELVPTPPSSLSLDQSASAARSGRAELKERVREHTSTSPALTAGDIDADWEAAGTVGDEAPGGDNPTPDQDVVDDIGRALGVEYDDDEELQGGDEIVERDRKRWELDPASSDDFDDRE
jgi:Family of unknown function (DUF6335)